MLKGPVEPQLQFAIKTLSSQNQQNRQNPQMARQIASSSGYGTMIPTPGTMIPTPGTTQGTTASSGIPYVTDNNALSSSGGGMVPQNANMGASIQGPISNRYQHLSTNIPQNSTTNNVQSTMGSVGVQRQLPHMIPTPGLSNQQNESSNPDYSNGTGYFNGESAVAPHMQQMNQVPGTGVGGADGLPQHQPMQEMAALSGTDQQFIMFRTTMREKIFEYIGRKQLSAEWRKRLPELAKRLEDILYRKFPNMSDYYNMMRGPVEPQLQFAIKTLSAQNQVSQKVKNPLHVSGGQIHKLRCHFCKKIGHFKKNCLKREKWFERKGILYDPTHKQT